MQVGIMMRFDCEVWLSRALPWLFTIRGLTCGRRILSDVVTKVRIKLHQCIRSILQILGRQILPITAYFSATHLKRLRIKHVTRMQDFCFNAASALGSRRVICKYRETKQSRGSRTSRIIFALRSALLGTRYLPRKRSQRLPLVRCSKRSWENITRGNPGWSYRPGCSVN